MLCFAYGSNMDCAQMRERCPSSRFVCVVKLPDHHLVFPRKSQRRCCGVASVEPADGANVWGVVYKVAERDVPHLDRTEGYQPGRARNSYDRKALRVLRDGDPEKPIEVEGYIAVRQETPPLPSRGYRDMIVNAARFWHLPEAYVKSLEQIEVTE